MPYKPNMFKKTNANTYHLFFSLSLDNIEPEEISILNRALVNCKLLSGATLITRQTATYIQFRALSASFLCDIPSLYLDLERIEKLMKSLLRQLETMKNDLDTPASFFGFNTNKIAVINYGLNNETYVYLDWENIVRLEHDGDTMIITSPPLDLGTQYFSPEQLGITTIPNSVPYQSVYYSLGKVVLILMNQSSLSDITPHSPFYRTSVYYLLSRCLEEDYTQRNIMWV